MKFSLSLSLCTFALLSSAGWSAVQAVTFSSTNKSPVDVIQVKDLPAVNPWLSYFGVIDDSGSTPTVTCMHGPSECAGNIQQLCFKKYFPDHKYWYAFVVEMNSKPNKIGDPHYAREAGERIVNNTEYGSALDQVDKCAAGSEGLDLLIESVKNTVSQGATASCTIFIDGQKRCVVDGGVWRECPEGHDISDFVRSIKDVAARLRAVWLRERSDLLGNLGAMPLPVDDDFDFGDLDALELDLEEQGLLAAETGTRLTGQANPSNVQHRNYSHLHASPFNADKQRLATNINAVATAVERDEFDEFGDLEDVLLNDDLLDEVAVQPSRDSRPVYFQPHQRAQPQLQPQPRLQRSQTPAIVPPAQPTKLFSIFGGNKNPSANKTPIAPATRNILPRSDPSNDFAADIFRSPEAPVQTSNPPTHHEIDKEAALTWQYPINYPKRDYQYNIIRRALFTNTLVSLPTGLGKTFIAAVVMLNFFRWFPKSKIIFMAPTRPLVNQQIEACFNVCGIPQEDTIELTGQQNADLRKEMWIRKRVVFCTPQVLQNDLISGICPAEAIVCLVVDEAHRATGRYAYSEVIRLLDPLNRDIRIMALTATPGGDIKTVQQVVQNLKIAKIELRTEDSMDLQKYVFKRSVQEMVVPCGREVGEIRDKFSRMIRPFLDRLAKQGIVRTTDPGQLSRFALLQGRDGYLKEHPQHSGTKSYMLKQVGICMGLIHAYELLTIHGIKPFFANMDPFSNNNQDTSGGLSGKRLGGAKGAAGGKRKRIDDDWDREDDIKRSIARKAMEDIPDFVRMMDTIRIKMKQESFISHPKLERLVGVVVQHFVNHQDENDALALAKAFDRAESATSVSSSSTATGPTPASEDGDEAKLQTRVMIFANYRESVEEISRVLEPHRPLIKVQSFIGQATAKGKKGISQKEQQKVVADFQRGEHNVLVATSIGEEGLDIGDVDLIVCYDSHSSPIRMLQRMGRTGRKRKGKICVLLAEGQEEQKYRRSQTSYKTVQRAIAQGNNIQYYPHSPRILPPGPPPTCDLVRIHVPTYVTPMTGRKRRKIEDGVAGAGLKSANRSAFLDPQELARFQHRYLIPKREIRTISFHNACSKMLEQRKRSKMTPDKTFHVGHSTRTMGFITSVNQLANSRLDQSLASLTDNTIDNDPYSLRMLTLLKHTEEKGIETEDSISDSNPTSRRNGRGRISSDDDDDDDDGDKVCDDLTNTLPAGLPKKKIFPKPKRKNPAAKQTMDTISSSVARTFSSDSPSPPPVPLKTKSIASYFRTISDDEVDMEIMGGLGKGFSQPKGLISSEPEDSVSQELILQTDFGRPSSRRKGFEFREPLTPPALWYKADAEDDQGEDQESKDYPFFEEGTASFVAFELPPLPEPGVWYNPAPKSMRGDRATDFGLNASTGGEAGTSPEQKKYLLIVDSSEDELAKVEEDMFGYTPRSKHTTQFAHPTGSTASTSAWSSKAHSPGFMSANPLESDVDSGGIVRRAQDKGKGRAMEQEKVDTPGVDDEEYDEFFEDFTWD
ncbi:hypothetical protein BGX28_004267 [Mortierella sp. GBA30]|nr:hypothetical protein BGX28_004267 [Mortierella sp. GBA30]